ncbi:hypothetical protein MD484_g8500, partial [Candolleomyces efflorescens]
MTSHLDQPIWNAQERWAFARWQRDSNDLILHCKRYGGVFRIKWPLGVPPGKILKWLRDRHLVLTCFCTVRQRESPITYFVRNRTNSGNEIVIYCGQSPPVCYFEVNLTRIYNTTTLFYDYSTLFPVGLTEATYLAAMAAGPDVFCTQLMADFRREEESGEEAPEESLGGSTADTISKIPLLEGWFGDYCQTPTMTQRSCSHSYPITRYLPLLPPSDSS